MLCGYARCLVNPPWPCGRSFSRARAVVMVCYISNFFFVASAYWAGALQMVRGTQHERIHTVFVVAC